jgi:hypothetical protein
MPTQQKPAGRVDVETRSALVQPKGQDRDRRRAGQAGGCGLGLGMEPPRRDAREYLDPSPCP